MSGQAIILAGGKGQRLWPLTSDKPKCMVEICGMPIISYQLHWLRRGGCSQVTIAAGHQHEVVQAYVNGGERWGLSVKFSLEHEPLGRGGALKKAMLLADPKDAVLAVNGDILSNLDLNLVRKNHNEHMALASVVAVHMKSPYGIMEIDTETSMVSGFREKPELPYEINAGIYMLSSEIVPRLPDFGDHEVETFPDLACEKKLLAYRASGCFWRSVDTVKDVSELAIELERVLLGALFQPIGS